MNERRSKEPSKRSTGGVCLLVKGRKERLWRRTDEVSEVPLLRAFAMQNPCNISP